jgi:hypothetical protein
VFGELTKQLSDILVQKHCQQLLAGWNSQLGANNWISYQPTAKAAWLSYLGIRFVDAEFLEEIEYIGTIAHDGGDVAEPGQSRAASVGPILSKGVV